MMRYEITYDGGSRFVVAETDEDALAKFATLWTDYGSQPPLGWVTARWTIA